MSKLKDNISTLKETDMWSLILFSLFKLKDIPEYRALSELVYILDKESLMKLCEYFGGLSLKIPTIHELELIVYCLLLYQYVNIEHKDYKDAVMLLGVESSQLREIKSNYIKLCKVLDEYEFSSR